MIPVNTPLLDGNEKKYLLECIETGWISSEGPFVAEFEKKFSARVGRQHGIAVCNGSAALDVAVEALNIGPGDEVILPAFTIISCINQIIRAGATPVLVDSDPLTWNMDTTKVEEKISSRTRAIMIVHIYGLPTDVDPILGIANRHGLAIIEDAAEMHGQSYKGRPCGSFGDISTFSFYPNKHVTTGEGGMILTNNEKIANESRSLRNLCFQSDNRFVHERLGWNMRMTNMQAALGLAQLERLDEFLVRKRRMGMRYTQAFSALPHIQTPLVKTGYAENVYWVYGLLLHEGSGIDAKTAMRRLSSRGIGTRPFFCPMHQQPVLLRMGHFKGESYPVSERLYKQGFYIPSGIGLSDDDTDQVINAVLQELA
jgi:perosamine synthetase